MEPTPITTNSSRQSTLVRFAWFLAGAVFSYLLISTPFKYLKTHTHLPDIAVSGCSIAVSTVLFFFWNYFVNFRTDSRKRDALARYLISVAIMWMLQSLTLTALEKADLLPHLKLGNFPINLNIVATQFCLGWVKFLLYHKWAFPAEKKAGGQVISDQ